MISNGEFLSDHLIYKYVSTLQLTSADREVFEKPELRLSDTYVTHKMQDARLLASLSCPNLRTLF